MSFLTKLFRKKPIKDCMSYDTKLERELTLFQLLFHSLSKTIGAGIFIVIGNLIKYISGPAANISMIISAIIISFTALCYCELICMVPKAGSTYLYTYMIIGELPAFIIGWTLISGCIFAIVSGVKGFVGTVDVIINGKITNWTMIYLPLIKNPTDSDIIEPSIDILSFIILFLLLSLSFFKTDILMTLNSIICIIVLLMSIVICISCFIYGKSSNYLDNGGYTPFGIAGIIQGAGICVFAFSGFETIANSVEEAKNPLRDIPKALLYNMLIAFIVYFSLTSALPYLVPRSLIDIGSPFVYGFKLNNATELYWLSTITVLIITSFSKLSFIYVTSRFIYALSNDRLISHCFSHVNDCNKIPMRSTLLAGLLAMIISLFFRINLTAEASSSGFLVGYIMTGLNLFILRYTYIMNEYGDIVRSNEINLRFEILNKRIFSKFFFNILCCIFCIVLLIVCICLFSRNFINSNISNYIGVSGFIILIIITILLCMYSPNIINTGYSTPMMPLSAIVSFGLNTCLLFSLSITTFIITVIWILIGLVVYFIYGYRNSQENKLNYEELKCDKP